PGTASIAFHHGSGRMEGQAGMWGYVKGGTGMVSFILADIAREAGAVIAAGLPVAAILPGQGVELTGGDRITAPVVISNADPQVTLRLLGAQADAGWQAQVEATPIEGCTVKLSVGLHELPNFTAQPGTNELHHTAQINTPLSKQEWRDSYALARQGQIAPRLWTELYFQSAQDRSVVPEGKHVMSAFCQYVPYHFADGDWNSRRDEVGQTVINSIARFCSNFPAAIQHVEVMGPPDIEAKVGLTGGHIFQGSCLPATMWDRRLTCRTPMEGVYLCGAATHPGGSVIAINGRNAAMQVLQDK
ncbi:MAG: NAD(P)/FAD-dependent oxidoreductase, partial [Anaerolineae bacterium]|nr:NAD(P)/FAD-dependent oxidoreductase [Anaerolineae bacterium]